MQVVLPMLDSIRTLAASEEALEDQVRIVRDFCMKNFFEAEHTET